MEIEVAILELAYVKGKINKILTFDVENLNKDRLHWKILLFFHGRISISL